MGKRITVKEVNERVDLLRNEFDEFKGTIETVGLSVGEMGSRAGKILSESLAPMNESIKGIEDIVNRLLERVKKLENASKKSRWKFWQRTKK